MVNIGTAPLGDVFAMLHAAVALVAKNTGMSMPDTLATIQEIDDFAKQTGQK